MKLILRFLFFAVVGIFTCLASIKTAAVEHPKLVHRHHKSIPRAIATHHTPGDAP